MLPKRATLVLALALISAMALSAQNLSFGSQPARTEPDWVNRLTIYEIWLKAFTPEGTLRAASARLKNVAELGAGAVYLSPIAKRSATPHASPYNIADYNAIDPDYGSEQDLRDFVATAHGLHLRVLLDIVYYHAAPDSVMGKDPDAFVKTADGRVARGFWPQPLPNYANPRVRQYLIDSLVHWVRDFGVDGFRCDVGGGVPVKFWEEARTALDRVKPNVILLSESERPDDQLRAFDINYDFNYYLTLLAVVRDGNPAIELRRHWERMNATMPRGARILRFDDNQDWRRPVLEFGEKGSMACSVLDFTLDGIPFLYNGQEIGDALLTRWNTPAPIDWPSGPRVSTNGDHRKETLAFYEKLFRMRNEQPALTSDALTWIDNTAPDSVLSFLRGTGDNQVLVILNLSNRHLEVTVDLPVMDNYVVDNLLTPGQTWFQLYSGRVSAKLDGFGWVVGKRVPLAPLEPSAATASPR